MIKGFSVTQVLSASGVTLSPSNVWNSAGTTFTGIQFDVTDTASAAASALMNLLIGGASRFLVAKTGRVDMQGDLRNYASGGGIRQLSDTGYFAIGISDDAVLTRDAADTFAQRRGTNAQTKRIYGTYTNASNYRRVAIGMTTGGVASIAPEGAGTGASGNVLHISGLPTANPGPGILWNNGGTVEVGT